ncbi:carbohydrate ABC transporter permease [Chelatococcus asaccharovorans]|uniref:Carbohydrate ABC transporter membrane protein 2 (CUT1 family) n=1 Tax=Chelatococcus asaccharovorans TaxID=28210 RepID=A0A2V3TW14_9HYPH|nr:carbohydrate ABC transporter permease [Chelatococcus asaccharovorans]MBS7702037.1 carbohydrate ABC transporter permease [Chelatococcus asaccharovorans]PXW52807.1 carbohydrate ABC transporter membrane protein 2 (CUT1 family) [Chelatococcus asaccharovorans]CAH1667318.1 Carbohydrate ABC transporter membrane protein 2 (CUT1 family) [Chelatococcus asaccharovorans]CAH1681021.1 Carbohydrate ABC transporter membrane protein 2 (CUT1 family) [Chelatococcus asaccharovorans]
MTTHAGETRSRIMQAGIHIALAAGAVFMLLPFWLMLRTSFTAPDQIFSGNVLTLTHFSLDNYARVFAEVPLLRYYLNGFVVVGTIFLGQVVICVPAAYALSRLRFAGRELGLWIVLAAMMVPYHATAIPIYVLLSQFGLINTHGALILPFIGSAFSVFLLRQFFLSIPQSVFESARLDGASPYRILIHIVFPMARPAIITFGILSFVSHWNDYFWPSFVLRNDFAATVPFGIVRFLDQELGADYGPQMAAATLTVLPLLIGFLIAQRQLIAGIAMSSGQVD